jgi:hypothetical protein
MSAAKYFQAVGDFLGDRVQNQLTFKRDDIIKYVPGGNADWAIGMVVFSNGHLVADSTPLFYPSNFAVAVEWSPPERAHYYLALAAFAGDPAQHQLSFNEGDIIKLLPGGTTDWGIGVVVHAQGTDISTDEVQGQFFPMTFVEPTFWEPGTGDPAAHHIEYCIALGTYRGDPAENHISFEEGDVIHVLELAPGGDEHWILGTVVFSHSLDRPVKPTPPGFFPAEFVDIHPHFEMPPTYYRALVSFTAEDRGQLSFRPGDVIKRFPGSDVPDWALGVIVESGGQPADLTPTQEEALMFPVDHCEFFDWHGAQDAKLLADRLAEEERQRVEEAKVRALEEEKRLEERRQREQAEEAARRQRLEDEARLLREAEAAAKARVEELLQAAEARRKADEAARAKALAEEQEERRKQEEAETKRLKDEWRQARKLKQKKIQATDELDTPPPQPQDDFCKSIDCQIM